MKTLIIALLISFSALAVDPGGGGGGGPLTKVRDFIVINGELHIPVEIFNQYEIYSKLAEAWELEKIKVISNQAVVIDGVEEIEYNNRDYLLAEEVEQEISIPATAIQAIHFFNGNTIDIRPENKFDASIVNDYDVEFADYSNIENQINWTKVLHVNYPVASTEQADIYANQGHSLR